MSDKPSYEDLEQQIKRLELTVARTRRAEMVNKTLFHIASALNTSETLQDLYRSIHRHLSSLMDMTNFFIAVYYPDKNAVQYVFRRDQEAALSPKWIHNFSKNPSLTGDVILKKKPLLLDEKELGQLAAKGRVLGSLPKNWLGVPLMIQGDVLGVMAVKSYNNPIKYTQDHVELLSFVSETIAVAIEKKRAENELLQARERLLRSQKLEAIGTLAGGIAHDFNNTLSITLGNINLAQMIASSDPVKEYLADAEQSILQAKELASKFVVFSKGGGIRIKSHIDTHGFITDTLAPMETEHGVRFTLNIEDLPPVMEADKEQLQEAFRNIVINAGEAMDKAKPVRIEAKSHPDKQGMVLISVTDHGRGIAEGDVEKVFDPYFSTKPMGKSKGTGLGLSIAWAIVKNHQGTIRIESSLGQGTRVDMVLPVFQKEGPKTAAAKAVKKESAPARRISSRKPLVLFMDDDAMILEITGKILERLGYEPVLARTGEEAVDKYRSCLLEGKIIGKVILDLEVKHGMGGVEAMEKLLSLNPGIKGIVASGYSNDPTMENCTYFGFSAALSKPFSIETLKKALHDL
ncbi:MAG TPA: histidine kinase [Desulfobacteraceae bacterium]|nr:histidine kinase [Desulfobacteraceae bacterium]